MKGILTTIAAALASALPGSGSLPQTPYKAPPFYTRRELNRSKYSPVECERARLRGRTDLPGGAV